MSFEKLWWGLCGVATTMAARKIASSALRDEDGEPKLSKTTGRNSGLGLMFVLAAASGVLLALGDVLTEHRKRIVDVGL